MIPPARRRARPGLSLLEVLLATAIFLLSLVAIGGLVDFGSQRGTAAAMQAAGTRLAQSKLAEVEAGVLSPTAGGTGTFDEEPDWNWAVEAGSAAVPNVYPVTVRVWHDKGGRKYEVVLSQMVCDPAQMGTAAPARPPAAAGASGGTGTQAAAGGTGS